MFKFTANVKIRGFREFREFVVFVIQLPEFEKKPAPWELRIVVTHLYRIVCCI